MDTVPRHRIHWQRKCRAIATIALLAVTGGVAAQSLGQSNDRKDVDVMEGFPPSPAMRVTKTNAFQPPYMRWAFRHARETSPTAGVRHASTPMTLPERPAASLDDVQFNVEGQSVKLSDYLRDTHTDGFIVLHKGQIVFERYLDGFFPENRKHLTLPLQPRFLPCRDPRSSLLECHLVFGFLPSL